MQLDFETFNLASSHFESEWQVPELVHFDENLLVVEFDKNQPTSLNWLEFENEGKQYEKKHFLQGVFKLQNKEIIQFRSKEDEYLYAFKLNTHFNKKEASTVAEFYAAADFKSGTYGNIPHRKVNKEFRRMGIADYVFERFEKYLKEVKCENAIVGTNDIETFEKFLKHRGYRHSKSPKFADDADDEFIKRLKNLKTEKTDNFEEYIKFPVIAFGKTLDLSIKIVN